MRREHGTSDELLSRADDVGGQGGDGDHLRPDELGAFLDGALVGAELSRVQAHLVKCVHCREEAIKVGRLTGSGSGNGSRRRSLAYRLAPVAAVAAIAALMLLRPGDEELARQGSPVLRDGDREFAAIMTVAPASGSAPSVDSVTFVWHAVESDVAYRLTLMDAEGVVLWKGTVEDTTVALPTDVELFPESRYYWYVDALLELAQTATSGVQEFVTSP